MSSYVHLLQQHGKFPVNSKSMENFEYGPTFLNAYMTSYEKFHSVLFTMRVYQVTVYKLVQHYAHISTFKL